jgi:hypothetical protein
VLIVCDPVRADGERGLCCRTEPRAHRQRPGNRGAAEAGGIKAPEVYTPERVKPFVWRQGWVEENHLIALIVKGENLDNWFRRPDLSDVMKAVA